MPGRDRARLCRRATEVQIRYRVRGRHHGSAPHVVVLALDPPEVIALVEIGDLEIVGEPVPF